MDWEGNLSTLLVVLAVIAFGLWAGALIVSHSYKEECKAGHPIVIEHKVYRCVEVSLPEKEKP